PAGPPSTTAQAPRPAPPPTRSAPPPPPPPPPFPGRARHRPRRPPHNPPSSPPPSSPQPLPIRSRWLRPGGAQASTTPEPPGRAPYRPVLWLRHGPPTDYRNRPYRRVSSTLPLSAPPPPDASAAHMSPDRGHA